MWIKILLKHFQFIKNHWNINRRKKKHRSRNSNSDLSSSIPWMFTKLFHNGIDIIANKIVNAIVDNPIMNPQSHSQFMAKLGLPMAFKSA